MNRTQIHDDMPAASRRFDDIHSENIQEVLAAMLEAYRNGERGLPTYQELAELTFSSGQEPSSPVMH